MKRNRTGVVVCVESLDISVYGEDYPRTAPQIKGVIIHGVDITDSILAGAEMTIKDGYSVIDCQLIVSEVATP